MVWDEEYGTCRITDEEHIGTSELPPVPVYPEFFTYEIVAVSHLGEIPDEAQ